MKLKITVWHPLSGLNDGQGTLEMPNLLSRSMFKKIKIFLNILVVFLPSLAYSQDILLNGNDILLIENQSHTHKGNIILNGNSQLIIRNSTFNFEQDYHEQLSIKLFNNSSLVIEDSIIMSSYRFFLCNYNESNTLIKNSVALQSVLIPNDNANLICTDSELDLLGDQHSYSKSTKANIFIQNCNIQQLSLLFPLNAVVNLQNFKKELIQDFHLLKNNTGLPYDLFISNTVIEGTACVWIKDSAKVTFNNCEFFQVAVDQQASVVFIDSSITQMWIYCGYGSTSTNNMAIENLKSGYIEKSNIDLSYFNSVNIDLSNTSVSNWCVKTAGLNNPLHIVNSQIYWFRPMYSDSEITITDTTIEELLIWDFRGILNFENTVVMNWKDTRNYSGYSNNFQMKGNVVFDKAWKIKLLENSKLINEQNLIMYSSTPLIVDKSQGIFSVIVLTKNTPNHIITTGSNVHVYGTKTSNQITLESGARAELINFPGQNSIHIQSSSDVFSVSRSGTVVTFQRSDGTMLKIPATTSIQTISFVGEESRVLQIHNNQVMLDDQVVTATAAAIFAGSGLPGPCGAYVAPGVWKEFDCYNLAAIGKTTNDDPFTPSWRLI